MHPDLLRSVRQRRFAHKGDAVQGMGCGRVAAATACRQQGFPYVRLCGGSGPRKACRTQRIHHLGPLKSQYDRDGCLLPLTQRGAQKIGCALGPAEGPLCVTCIPSTMPAHPPTPHPQVKISNQPDSCRLCTSSSKSMGCGSSICCPSTQISKSSPVFAMVPPTGNFSKPIRSLPDPRSLTRPLP